MWILVDAIGGTGNVANGAGPNAGGGIALIDATRFGILQQDGPHHDDGFLADGDAGTDLREGSHPGTILDDDGFGGHAHAGIGPVVIAGAEIGALGDADVAADGDGNEVIDPGTLTKPDVVPHREPPWMLDVEIGLDEDVLPDLRAERPQDAALQP